MVTKQSYRCDAVSHERFPMNHDISETSEIADIALFHQSSQIFPKLPTTVLTLSFHQQHFEGAVVRLNERMEVIPKRIGFMISVDELMQEEVAFQHSIMGRRNRTCAFGATETVSQFLESGFAGHTSMIN